MVRPLRSGDRVLVRLPSWLGDAVQAEPALRALSAELATRSCALSLAGPESLLPVFDGRFEDARRIPHAGRGGETADAWRGHDVALLFTGSFRSAWTALRAGIQRRVGWSRDSRSALLTEGMRPSLERGGRPLGIGLPGRARRFLPRSFVASCVELVGLLGVPVHDTRPRLQPTDAARDAAQRRLARLGIADDARPVVANVGSRPGSTKGVPAGIWAATLELLSRRVDQPLVLVCGPGEEDEVEQVVARLAQSRPAAVLDPPAGLGELIALFQRAGVVLGTDTGPRHVAVAVGAAVVSVLGPTDPRHGADHLLGQRTVRREVDCGPCHLEACPLPAERRHVCMREIDPEVIVERALELL